MAEAGEVAARLAGITGHPTFGYGQSSYDGDFCRTCSWQGGRNSGAAHTEATRLAALTEVLAAEKAKWQAGALDQVRADIRAESMIRAHSVPQVFFPSEVFDLAERYTPEWVAQVLADREIEKGADRG